MTEGENALNYHIIAIVLQRFETNASAQTVYASHYLYVVMYVTDYVV